MKFLKMLGVLKIEKKIIERKWNVQILEGRYKL